MNKKGGPHCPHPPKLTFQAQHLQAFAGVISSLPAGKPAKKKKAEGAKLSTNVQLIFDTSVPSKREKDDGRKTSDSLSGGICVR
jgi:hypothetical protein